MKLITKLLLINWHYFVHETISFGQLNFLTGKNASGKSTIIDAMQIVLYGDTSGSFFNKAANGKGNRTLMVKEIVLLWDICAENWGIPKIPDLDTSVMGALQAT